jgi:hypothetical protein
MSIAITLSHRKRKAPRCGSGAGEWRNIVAPFCSMNACRRKGGSPLRGKGSVWALRRCGEKA